MAEHEVTTTELLEFMKEHMVTKADLDLAVAKLAAKEELAAVKNDTATIIDGLAKQHIVFDHELVALQSKYNRLEERIEVVEHKLEIA